jgi:hypothetical protein
VDVEVGEVWRVHWKFKIENWKLEICPSALSITSMMAGGSRGREMKNEKCKVKNAKCERQENVIGPLFMYIGKESERLFLFVIPAKAGIQGLFPLVPKLCLGTSVVTTCRRDACSTELWQ